MNNPEVSTYIESAKKEHQEILAFLRSLIFEAMPEVKEEFKWSRPVYYRKELLCYLLSNKNYVTIGFYKGALELPDPKGKLEGSGKEMRHLKVRSLEDLDQEELVLWLKQLYELN